MAKNKIEELVTELVTSITEEQHFELVDVEFVKEGASWYLRIFIDKQGGITVDDCEIVSRALEVKLDELDPIEQAYMLEVSSPGLDRPLKKEADFERFKGEMVELKLYKSQLGKKIHVGELVGLIDGKVVILDEEQKEIGFLRNDIAIVRLAVVF